MKVAFPGTFDPIHHGHLHFIERASKIFTKVFVVVAHNLDKQSLPLQTRYDKALKEVTKLKLTNVEVVQCNEMLVDYLNKIDCHLIIRGFRDATDADYEILLASQQYEISKHHIETLFLPALIEDIKVSSTSIRNQILKLQKETK